MKKHTPQIMGILNITPDSFYDGGRYLRVEDAKQQIEKMIAEGVDIIDVGGFSSKPGTTLPTVEEELGRILPVLDVLDTYHMPFSVDTCRSEVVKEILKYKNLRYTNDISGLTDEKILPLISGTGVGYILMHIQGTPETMQQNPHYDDVVSEVYNFLEKKIAVIQAAGVTDIVVDPGFGFGKTIEHNYGLLRNIGRLTELGYPVLAGLSRKSMIWRLLDTTPDDTLTETVALHLFALQNGANILRVHDVKEHVRALKISEIIISSSREEDIFDKWNTLKKQVDRREQKNFYVKEREVWYVHIGKNIGYESLGKGRDFKRPVLVLKRIGSMFLCVSMTTKGKKGFFYYELPSEIFAKPSYVTLSQVKTIDHKRFIEKLGIIPKKEFSEIKKRIRDFLS